MKAILIKADGRIKLYAGSHIPDPSFFKGYEKINEFEIDDVYVLFNEQK